jgi:hypothetical protein
MNPHTRQILDSAQFKECTAALKPRSMPFQFTTSTEIYQHLGRSIVAFQTLEASIKSFIQVILDMDKNSLDIVTSNLSFRKLSSTLWALAKKESIKECQTLEPLLTCVRQAEELRNGLIHSHWVGDSRLKITVKSVDGLRSQSEKYSVEDLSEIREFIEDLTSCIFIVMFQYLKRCKTEGRCPKCAFLSDAF